MKAKLKYKVGDVIRIKSYTELRKYIIDNTKKCIKSGFIQVSEDSRLKNLDKNKEVYCSKELEITSIGQINFVDAFYICKIGNKNFSFSECQIKKLVK